METDAIGSALQEMVNAWRTLHLSESRTVNCCDNNH